MLNSLLYNLCFIEWCTKPFDLTRVAGQLLLLYYRIAQRHTYNTIIMFDRSDPSLMLRNGGLTDDVQYKLRQAVERALKAEVK